MNHNWIQKIKLKPSRNWQWCDSQKLCWLTASDTVAIFPSTAHINTHYFAESSHSTMPTACALFACQQEPSASSIRDTMFTENRTNNFHFNVLYTKCFFFVRLEKLWVEKKLNSVVQMSLTHSMQSRYKAKQNNTLRVKPYDSSSNTHKHTTISSKQTIIINNLPKMDNNITATAKKNALND